MLSVLPCKNVSEIKEIFAKYNLNYNENSGCVIARDREEILGECLYLLDDKGILILRLEPQDDIMLADGILRSALHQAAEKSAMDAHYSPDAPEAILMSLGFIKDQDSRTLDIDKLFGSCCSCK